MVVDVLRNGIYGTANKIVVVVFVFEVLRWPLRVRGLNSKLCPIACNSIFGHHFLTSFSNRIVCRLE